MYLNSEMADPFEIIVGTYEQYLIGYKVCNIVNEYKVEKSFAIHSHVASIRSVASNKHYLASAGADDVVCLYDMRQRRESGKLLLHNDTINCLVFTPEASHLFTCSRDGSIAAIRCGNWQTEKYWHKAHKGHSVNTLAIHPTGKLALSAGMDGILRTWNLIKGRQAYAVNLATRFKQNAKNITIIKWSPNGEKYLLVIDKKIDVYFVETAGLYTELVFDSKVICAEFLENDLIAIGLEDGQIKFCDLRTSKETLKITAHDIRVKCIARVNDLLVSASSSGEIKLWKYSKQSLDMLQTVNCGARITCLALASSYPNNLVRQDELEEEKEITKKNEIRIKQEVIIEDEGEQESIDIITSTKKMKHKKKRAIEDVEDNRISKKKVLKLQENTVPTKKRNRSLEKEDTIHKPKKKKILKLSEEKLSGKIRKRNSTVLRDSSLVKKFKKTSTVTQSSINKKHKAKLPIPTDTEDAPPKKKKKKVDLLGKVMPKKKRKSTSKIN